MELCLTIPTGALENLTMLVDLRTVWRSTGPTGVGWTQAIGDCYGQLFHRQASPSLNSIQERLPWALQMQMQKKKSLLKPPQLCQFEGDCEGDNWGWMDPSDWRLLWSTLPQTSQSILKPPQLCQCEGDCEGDRRCPRGWTTFGRRCYKYFSKSAPWITAERNCQSFGANLASVHDRSENDFLLSLLPSSTRTWVGAHDGEQDGDWLWRDGTVFDYANWCSGEPNNAGGPENCLEINWTYWGWMDPSDWRLLWSTLPQTSQSILKPPQLCQCEGDCEGDSSFQVHHGNAEKSSGFCYLLHGVDGEWLWSDGTVFDYTNWCSGEPNNAGGPENCLEINWTSLLH
ncbi:unnamed protein product [Leuciscus chuanchicus]